MLFGDNKDRILSSLMSYFVLLLIFSLFVSLFIKNKKVIFSFCISLLICYAISATVFNFYESEFWKNESVVKELSLVTILIFPSLLLTLIWWWFTRKRK